MDKYKVILPICVGEGKDEKTYLSGDTIQLDPETAAQYAHALHKVEVKEEVTDGRHS